MVIIYFLSPQIIAMQLEIHPKLSCEYISLLSILFAYPVMFVSLDNKSRGIYISSLVQCLCLPLPISTNHDATCLCRVSSLLAINSDLSRNILYWFINIIKYHSISYWLIYFTWWKTNVSVLEYCTFGRV